MASLSHWTMSYFAAALACLVLAEILLVSGVGYPAAGPTEPTTLIVVHLVTIGWLSLAMAGALLQFVPVLVSRPLAFPHLALPALLAVLAGLSLLCAGFTVLAGWTDWPLDLLPLAVLPLGIGFALLILMLATTIGSARPLALFPRFVLAGLACLAATVLSGAAFATLLAGRSGWFDPAASLADALPFHALLGLGGWLGLTAFGVSYKLLVMFMMTPETPPRTTELVLACAGVALALAGAGLIAALAGVATGTATLGLVLAGLASATAIYGRDVFALYRLRRRKALEINMLASVAAFAALALGAALMPLAAIGGAGDEWIAALAFLLVFGWLSGLTLAQLVKIVSFMTWLEVYAPLIGRTAMPRVGDLIAMPRTGWWFMLYFGGVAAGTLALALTSEVAFRSAVLLCLTGTAGIAVELVRVRCLAEIEPARQPRAHNRPRLFLPDPSKRRESDAAIRATTGPRA
ncbi:hypothetical protein [Bosea vaviloviae]|uniref:hypothetical protein n=2 Tax=Bosea TaxID=85413 RepID=UPI001AEC59E0|nr:hypothetical protein [Bosea vaviloviae]